MKLTEGRLPDLVAACVGGGSNAIGIFSRFIGEEGIRLVAVEAAGDGIDTGHHAAALAAGGLGIIHGARTMLLQDPDGQVQEAHSISAGLDYPGVGPQLAALAAEGRLELRSATDSEALAAMRQLAACEGILPALESAHALAALPGLVDGMTPGCIVLLGLSGRGDKDVAHLTSPS
jgi:tryptophan synthase beta chain